jgi:hypothetical protein
MNPPHLQQHMQFGKGRKVEEQTWNWSPDKEAALKGWMKMNENTDEQQQLIGIITPGADTWW